VLQLVGSLVCNTVERTWQYMCYMSSCWASRVGSEPLHKNMRVTTSIGSPAGISAATDCSRGCLTFRALASVTVQRAPRRRLVTSASTTQSAQHKRCNSRCNSDKANCPNLSAHMVIPVGLHEASHIRQQAAYHPCSSPAYIYPTRCSAPTLRTHRADRLQLGDGGDDGGVARDDVQHFIAGQRLLGQQLRRSRV